MTAPTLPAMTDKQIAEALGLNPESPCALGYYAIARAIILKPKVVVLDEPTSALDRQVQKQIVDLLRDLQQAHHLSYLFISHDLAVVRAMADHIMVMKDGKMVEQGTPDEVMEHPREDYTRRLMAAAFAE